MYFKKETHFHILCLSFHCSVCPLNGLKQLKSICKSRWTGSGLVRRIPLPLSLLSFSSCVTSAGVSMANRSTSGSGISFLSFFQAN